MEDPKRVEGDEVHGDKVGGDKVAGDKAVVSPHMGDMHGSMGITAGRDVIYTADAAGSEMKLVNDYLARVATAYEARMYQLVARPAALPDQPYKFLYAFEIEDADVFFGRDAASETFYQTLLKDRLTVLHARSGAGKTSLLNAGLSPRLIREGRLPVYARSYEDPVLAVKRAIAPPSLGPWPELLPKLTLHEFLGLTCAHLSRKPQELVIIFDQFEEFFVFWPERDHRRPFIEALADCYDDNSLPIRFVIALRKDYYSDLATFQGRLPHIFHNEYYLEAMTRDEAQKAITGPVAKLDRPVTYEQDLLDTLLDDLARGGPVLSAAEGIELPHLQIICTRLYEALAEGEMTITLDSYKQLGRAEGVLGGYLNNVLDRLPGRGGVIAREVLKELVSSEATKRVLSYGTLAARVEAEREELDGVLAQLVGARLLRRDEVAGEITYEMAHEYLIQEIEKWIDLADLEFKQAEELLRREVANWRVHGTLIPRERLELLYVQRERFRGLDEETLEWILRSALRADFAVENWAKLVGEVGEKLLLAALGDQREEIRRPAMRGLGALWGIQEVSGLGSENDGVRWDAVTALRELGDPRAVEPLIAALQDEDSSVRCEAAKALARLGDPRAIEPLIAALRDEDSGVRREAAEALARLGDPRATEPLIAALRDEDSGVRCETAWVLGRLDDPRTVEPLIAALRDEDWEVRQAAAEALEAAAGALEDLVNSRVLQPLIGALRDEDRGVRCEVAWVLGELGDPRTVEPLIGALRDKDRGVRRAAAEALKKCGEPVVEPLIAALRDENRDMRRAAAGALGKIGDPSAVEPLIGALQDEDMFVRQPAARALGEIGGPRAIEPLIAALRDEDGVVCWEAAKALRKIGTPKALAALEKWQR